MAFLDILPLILPAVTGIIAIVLQLFILRDSRFKLEIISTPSPYSDDAGDIDNISYLVKWLRIINGSGKPITIISMHIEKLSADSTLQDETHISLPLIIEPYCVAEGYFLFTAHNQTDKPHEGQTKMRVVTSRKTADFNVTIDYTNIDKNKSNNKINIGIINGGVNNKIDSITSNFFSLDEISKFLNKNANNLGAIDALIHDAKQNNKKALRKESNCRTNWRTLVVVLFVIASLVVIYNYPSNQVYCLTITVFLIATYPIARKINKQNEIIEERELQRQTIYKVNEKLSERLFLDRIQKDLEK
jgi:hypothetical protein